MHHPFREEKGKGSLDPALPHTVRSKNSCRQFHRIFALLVELLIILLMNFGETAYAEKRALPDGSGIFALPLEQLLEIDVTSNKHLPKTRDGLFSIIPSALPRTLVGSPEQAPLPSSNVPLNTHSLEIPIFVNGEYFGTVPSLGEVRRIIRKVFPTASRIEVYRGHRFTNWYEHGRYGILIDIRIDELAKETEVQP